MTSGATAVADVCLQGVEQDACSGSSMTPWVCWISNPEAWVGLHSLSIYHILLINDLGRTRLIGRCTFPYFLWLHVFYSGVWRMCIFPSLLCFLLSCLLPGWLLVSRCTVVNPGYATPWVGKPEHICCTELPGWISITSLDNFPILLLPDKRHYPSVILEVK